MYCFNCRDSIEDVGGLQFKGCYHFLCTECIVIAVSETNTLGLKCPAYENFQKCKGRIKHEILENTVPDDVYARYLERIATSNSPDYDYDETGIAESLNRPQSGRRNKSKAYTHHEKIQITEDDKAFGWAHQFLMFDYLVRTQGMSRRKATFFIENSPVLETRAVIECAICADDEVAVGQGVVLKECLHMFCKNCIANLIEFSEDVTVKCPYIDGNYSCIFHLQEREIKALVSNQVYEKLLEKSLKLGEATIENAFHCKTVDCSGWCVYDEGVEKFNCPICKKQNCIVCKAIHEESCEDFKNKIVQHKNDKLSEEALEELIRNGECMRCPKCKIPCQKISGCDWTQCVACKTELCWATKGPRWGPKGTGDTSGGCKCRAGADKAPCHPLCRNCH